jgi:hypothetical protein
MGRNYIEGLKDCGLKQEQLIRIHLQNNHYPPISVKCVPAVKKAIKLANKGCWDKSIKLWNGRKLKVSEMVEDLHLHTFLEG